jgi:polar amino acid transport system substrate-binding protein
MPDPLRVICVDCHAPPLILEFKDGRREGYEPAAIALVAEELGRPVEWVFRPWAEMVPTLNAHDGDAIWCGQGITDERRLAVDFTRPYAVFDEMVAVRAGSGIRSPEDLRGLRVGAIAHSTNMALAETFPAIVAVAFDGSSDDIFGEMVGALRSGEIDALVDDDVVTAPLGDEHDLEIAFTVPTRNRWGVAVAKDRPETRDAIDGALAAVIADGRLEAAWQRWMPHLDYPFAAR